MRKLAICSVKRYLTVQSAYYSRGAKVGKTTRNEKEVEELGAAAVRLCHVQIISSCGQEGKGEIFPHLKNAQVWWKQEKEEEEGGRKKGLFAQMGF